MNQVKQALENVLNALKAAVAGPRDVIHLRSVVPLASSLPLDLGLGTSWYLWLMLMLIFRGRHYIVNDSQDSELNKLDIVDRGAGEAWIEFMDEYGEGRRPPDTVLGVACLATRALLYEIECWAYVAE